MPSRGRLYVMLISAHGLLRSRMPELGRDADTGGQILYVVDLAKALIEHPCVEKVDLVTRQIEDPRVDDDYAQTIEPVVPGVNVVRVPCGPNRYIRKEALWPYVDGFVDNCVHYLRAIGRAPDLVHGHYADAGYVASRLTGLLDMPMAFTGHSLGRVKKERLLEQGQTTESVEKRYKIARRIEAEETALNHASFVVASTHQEVQDQYERYEFYQPRRMLVVPPGVDLGRFRPPERGKLTDSPVYDRVARFLEDPRKPMILAISRADPRKNIATLIKAFAETPGLREQANLVVVAGNRERIRDLDEGAREVMSELIELVDDHDLYGSVAYPKQHSPADIPEFYKLAAKTHGLFVNPALTEPFGLTLLEAAASGLPVVATDDGGPRDIVAHCRNGLLADPLDSAAIGNTLLEAISDRARWKKWSRNGISGSRKHFSWSAHVDKYMQGVQAAVSHREKRSRFFGGKGRLITADRIVVCDIDNTLVGDGPALKRLLALLDAAGERVAFGVATGRSEKLTREVLEEWKVPAPQLLITDVGAKIQYGPQQVEDRGWQRHINYRWRPDALREAMAELPGLELQGPEGQAEFKISYEVDPAKVPGVEAITRHLRAKRLTARPIYSHGKYLDLLPIRASKGMALRYFALQWGIPLERCLVAGDSGNDEEMLTGNTLGVVVGNHDPELFRLRSHPQIYFAPGHYAQGIIEGIDHYEFLGRIRWDAGETQERSSQDEAESAGAGAEAKPGRDLPAVAALR